MVFRYLALGLGLTAFLAGCGGGSSSSALPQAQTAPSAGSATQSVTVSIRIPAAPASTSALRRRPQYISAGTQSATIAVNRGTPVVINLAATSGNCTPASGGGRTCTAAVAASVGGDTFTEILYATTNGTGAALAQSTTSATIAAGKANVVNLVLDGIVSTIDLALANSTPPVGTPITIPLAVNFLDASGSDIIGGDPFVNPVSLVDSDKSGITKFTTTTPLTSPASAANLGVIYNGDPLTSATFSATATGATSNTVTLTPQAAGPVVFNDYTTFGYDNQRDVYNPNTTAITPTSVGSGTGLHLAWQANLNDFNMQSQPVLATEIPGHAGVLYLAGSSGNVYAIDALTGNAVWGSPVATGTEQYACDPNNPGQVAVFGAGGTVAYDPASLSLYSVGNSNAGPNVFGHNQLFRINAASGAIMGTPVDFGGSALNGNELNFSHTSVTLNNGIAYVGTGATCDIPSWRGRIARIDTRTNAVTTFYTVWDPTNQRGQGAQPWGGGGVWGWGGVSIDFSGNVVTGVGNTDNGSSFNGKIEAPFQAAPEEYSGFGEAVMQLSPDLSTVLAKDHPIPQSVYSGQATDLDVNGTPAIFEPLGAGCGPMAALQSKSGALLVYNEASINSGATSFQLAPSTFSDGFLGDPSFSPATGLLYAPIASTVSPTLLPPGLIAIKPCPGTPAPVWHTAFGPDSTSLGYARSVPAVSAGGVIFVATSCDALSGQCSAPSQNYGALWELDASTGTILNGGSPILYTSLPIRAPATVDGNWVFVVDQGGDVYGLTIDPSYPKIAAKRRSSGARAMFHRLH